MTFQHALVTGGAGFIGSHLARSLLTSGHRDKVHARQPSPGYGRTLGPAIQGRPLDVIELQDDPVYHLSE